MDFNYMDFEDEDEIYEMQMEDYFHLPYSKNRDDIRCALKSILAGHFHHSKTNIGFLTERQSLWVLIHSGLSKYVSERGVPFVNFRGMHTLVFNPLAAGRLRISMDCYIDFFLPRFCEELSKAMNTTKFTLEDVHAVILNAVIKQMQHDTCGLQDKLLISTIMTHRQLFGIQRPSNGYADSNGAFKWHQSNR